MASSSSAVNDSVILTEDDIPGASLAGRNPSSLKNEELRLGLGLGFTVLNLISFARFCSS